MAKHQKILPHVMSSDSWQAVSDIEAFQCVHGTVGRGAVAIMVWCTGTGHYTGGRFAEFHFASDAHLDYT
jgi:hypothetical protein